MPKYVKKPPLTLIHELLVLGGRYMFGRGATASGHPVLYISTGKGKPGLTILEDNLPAFRSALDEAIAKFDKVQTPASTERAPDSPAVSRSGVSCPGLADAEWRFLVETSIDEMDRAGDVDALESWRECLQQHDFIPHTVDGKPTTSCIICQYDTAKVKEYQQRAHRLREAQREQAEAKRGGVKTAKKARK